LKSVYRILPTGPKRLFAAGFDLFSVAWRLLNFAKNVKHAKKYLVFARGSYSRIRTNRSQK
jgi:hypothetical protein